MAYDTFTVTVKVENRDKKNDKRWTYRKEARHVEGVVREALREAYGRKNVHGVRASVPVPDEAVA